MVEGPGIIVHGMYAHTAAGYFTALSFDQFVVDRPVDRETRTKQGEWEMELVPYPLDSTIQADGDRWTVIAWGWVWVPSMGSSICAGEGRLPRHARVALASSMGAGSGNNNKGHKGKTGRKKAEEPAGTTILSSRHATNPPCNAALDPAAGGVLPVCPPPQPTALIPSAISVHLPSPLFIPEESSPFYPQAPSVPPRAVSVSSIHASPAPPWPLGFVMSEAEGAPGAGIEGKEQDRFLPIANIARIMRRAVPDNGKIAKDAKESVQDCPRLLAFDPIWFRVATSDRFACGFCRASDKCMKEKRKTISGEDLIWSLGTLGFEEYVEPLKHYFKLYREVSIKPPPLHGGSTRDPTLHAVDGPHLLARRWPFCRAVSRSHAPALHRASGLRICEVRRDRALGADARLALAEPTRGATQLPPSLLLAGQRRKLTRCGGPVPPPSFPLSSRLPAGGGSTTSSPCGVTWLWASSGEGGTPHACGGREGAGGGHEGGLRDAHEMNQRKKR
ncbi:hypothetical protein HU200_026423 [Digitaria exilis]|uniref:Transcription factor CBF/NF-Y/archaeal histone domain-containing protein n=1 Tax=Digitaria exilis TaxID=1010633 RepID=A0A835C0F1_9POAL|nr:hypothetical protein HU200_026423 [Digitaria exilis]